MKLNLENSKNSKEVFIAIYIFWLDYLVGWVDWKIIEGNLLVIIVVLDDKGGVEAWIIKGLIVECNKLINEGVEVDDV